MKLLLKISAGVVALLVVLLVGFNLLISADAVRERVAERVKQETGRDLKVNGSTSLLFLPNPHIVINDASITDPSDRSGATDLSIARLELDLNFRELLSREVDAEQVRMVRPVFTIRLGNGGERQGSLDSGPERHAELSRHFVLGDVAGGEHRDLQLNDVRIEDGTVRIVYDKQGTERRMEHIQAQFSLPHIADPLTGKGKLDWKGTPIDFELTLASPAVLRQGEAAKLDLALATNAIKATFKGSLATRPDLTGEGDLSANTQSLPSLVSWMRADANALETLGEGQLSSHVSWKPGEISFSEARFALAHGTGQGQAVLTLKQPRPYLRAALAVDQLDLTPLLPPKGGQQARQAPAPSAPNETPPPAANEAAPAAKPSKQGEPPQPSAQQAAPPPGQDATAMAAPADFDADVNLNVRQTKIAGVLIGASAIAVAMRDGILNATLGNIQLYGGQGQGKFTLDASKPVPSFSSELDLDGVQAGPLLTDAANFKLLSGITKVSVAISGAGRSMNEVRSSMTGNASLNLTDGAIQGLDLTALIKQVGSGEMPELNQGQDAKTAFNDLSGSFTINSGLARTTDLEMTSPLLTVTAKGTVDTIIGDINLLAEPEIVAGPQGKGGANDLAGVSLPIRIEGPLSHPNIKPELKSLFSNPDQAQRTVNQIGAVLQKKFKGKPVGEAIGKLLGGVKIGHEGAATGDDSDPPAVNSGGKKKPGRAEAPDAGEAPQDQGEQNNNSEPDDEQDPDLKEILR